MPLLYLSRTDLEAACPDDAAVMDAARAGILAHAEQRALAYPTLAMTLDDIEGGFYTIRGALTDSHLLGVKSVGAYPGNRNLGLPPDPGLMTLTDGRTGMPLAVLEGSFITTLRTAAMAAIGALELAPPNARVLGVIGARGIAPLAARMIVDALPIEEVRFHSASADTREAAANAFSGTNNRRAMAVANGGACIDGADIVLDGPGLTTDVALLPSECIAPGAIVVSYGAWCSHDDGIMTAVDRVVTDRWAGGGGALGRLVDAGLLDEAKIGGWLGEIVAGRQPARRNPDERILLWNRGLGACDITLANALLDRAHSLELGTELAYP